MSLEDIFFAAKVMLAVTCVVLAVYLAYHVWFYTETEEDLINHALDKIGRQKAAEIAARIVRSPNPVQLACEYEYKHQEDAQVRIEYAQRKNDRGRLDNQQPTLENNNG